MFAACLCAAAAAPAATINFTGSGTVANASGLVEFSIGKTETTGQRSLFLDPLGTPGYTDIVFFWEWYQDWLWVGLLMPEFGLTDRAFSHFIGPDYTQTWTVNRTHAPSEGARNANNRFYVQFTDGYVGSMRLNAWATWTWDGSTVVGTMPWNTNTFDPIANQNYLDNLPTPVADGGTTAALLLLAVGGLVVGRHRLKRTRAA
jgi:hypothetical protein